MKKKYVCVHGHFYQPPRENPWLESIEVQDSAHPFHDWNERIDRECYAPNTVSRVLTPGGRVREIANNFEKMSFNIGPTLFSWMETHDKETYARIIEADKTSIWQRSGHGSAMAQAYNHMIMPLASDIDKKTQIIWGIADFVHRFDRQPEGIWLPETAVDKKTLELLIDNDIVFTVLSQRQAKAIRPLGEKTWEPLNSGIDPTRPYKVTVSPGKSITVFFYDGPISQAVAFEGLLSSGEKFSDRLKTGFSGHREWDQLLHIATDGESYGHHHRFGEMTLTWALNHFANNSDAELTNYGEYLSKHPPVMEADIHENSSWSCAHGVERWRSDCGCRIGGMPGWNQKWRAPLRRALDILKTQLDSVFLNKGKELFHDPWETRNRYIEVILDRSRALDFLHEHARRELTRQNQIKALKLLEMQRNGMLMFTSCGWFFDDVSSIETVQIMKYAARAIQLCEEVSGVRPEKEFLHVLRDAKSNMTRYGDGETIYCRYVLPDKATLAKVVANHSIITTLDPSGPVSVGAAFSVNEIERSSEEYGDNALVVARERVVSSITMEEESFLVATLRLGGSDVTCFVKRDGDELGFTDVTTDLFSTWRHQPLTDVIRRLDANFDKGETFMLKDLFVEQRRRTVGILAAEHVKKFAETYRQLFWDNRRMMDYFIDAGVPIPLEFKLAAQYILEKELTRIAAEIENPDSMDMLSDLMWNIRKWGLEVNLQPMRAKLEERLLEKMEYIVSSRDMEAAPHMIRIMVAAQKAETNLDLWKIQNLFAKIYFDKNGDGGEHFHITSDIKKLGIMLNFSYNDD